MRDICSYLEIAMKDYYESVTGSGALEEENRRYCNEVASSVPSLVHPPGTSQSYLLM